MERHPRLLRLPEVVAPKWPSNPPHMEDTPFSLSLLCWCCCSFTVLFNYGHIPCEVFFTVSYSAEIGDWASVVIMLRCFACTCPKRGELRGYAFIQLSTIETMASQKGTARDSSYQRMGQ